MNAVSYAWHQNKVLLMLLVLLAILSSCTAQNHHIAAPVAHPAGFWLGVWQGFIAPITFIISLFSDRVTVWEIYNNGGWYTFGFLFGISFTLGGSSVTIKSKY